MEINGLPLHPLVLHAAVIFGPLAALIALAYAVLPRCRDRLRWITLVAVLIGVGAILVAYLSGENFLDSSRFDNFRGEALEKIEKHEGYAETLRLMASGFAIVTVLATWQHERTGALRMRAQRARRRRRGADVDLVDPHRRRRRPGRLER